MLSTPQTSASAPDVKSASASRFRNATKGSRPNGSVSTARSLLERKMNAYALDVKRIGAISTMRTIPRSLSQKRVEEGSSNLLPSMLMGAPSVNVVENRTSSSYQLTTSTKMGQSTEKHLVRITQVERASISGFGTTGIRPAIRSCASTATSQKATLESAPTNGNAPQSNFASGEAV